MSGEPWEVGGGGAVAACSRSVPSRQRTPCSRHLQPTLHSTTQLVRRYVPGGYPPVLLRKAGCGFSQGVPLPAQDPNLMAHARSFSPLVLCQLSGPAGSRLRLAAAPAHRRFPLPTAHSSPPDRTTHDPPRTAHHQIALPTTHRAQLTARSHYPLPTTHRSTPLPTAHHSHPTAIAGVLHRMMYEHTRSDDQRMSRRTFLQSLVLAAAALGLAAAAPGAPDLGTDPGVRSAEGRPVRTHAGGQGTKSDAPHRPRAARFPPPPRGTVAWDRRCGNPRCAARAEYGLERLVCPCQAGRADEKDHQHAPVVRGSW